MEDNLYKQFKKENPQTVGETDKMFDMSNYIEWLEKQLSPPPKEPIKSADKDLSKEEYEGLMNAMSKSPYAKQMIIDAANYLCEIGHASQFNPPKQEDVDWKSKYENLLKQFELFAEIISTENHPNNIKNHIHY